MHACMDTWMCVCVTLFLEVIKNTTMTHLYTSMVGNNI